MIHTFEMFDKYIALDVNSGCVHELDKLSYDVLNFLDIKGLDPEDDEALFKTVGEFAYCYRNAARAEVVAPLYKFRRVGISEQPLQFAFFGSVAFLNLRAAGVKRLYAVRL